MHCQEFFFRSDVNISDVIDFDAFNFSHTIAEADISKLPPELQELLKAGMALMEKRKNGLPLSPKEQGTLLVKMLALASLDTADPFARNLALFGRMIEHKDMTLFIEKADQMVAEKDFDSWVRLVLRIQRGYLTGDEKNFFGSLHPSWTEFSQRMGLIPHNAIEDLFYQRDLEWVSAKSLRKHFNKRVKNNELDIASENELLMTANAFLRSQGPAQVLYQRTDGLIFKYDSWTKELALVSAEGKIITYYTLLDEYRQTDSTNDYLGRTFLGLPFSANQNSD